MGNSLKKDCEICKIFSNSKRLEILLSLNNSKLNVSEIIKKTKFPQSVVSQHLAILKNKGIVEDEKIGSWITYTLKYPQILKAFEIMQDITKKIKK